MEGGGNTDVIDITIDSEYLDNVLKNNEFNRVILEYLRKDYSDFEYDTLKNRIERIEDCNRFWSLDKYQLAKIKDFKRTNLCKDKFCSNCKKVKQASRMARFMPHIKPYKDYLYQLVLTVPNVAGNALDGTIKEMYEAFPKLLHFLRCYKKIKGFDFAYLEYLGAIRSLEITYHGDNYHPHIHAILVFKGQIGAKVHKNDFSIDHYGNREDRLFSYEEIIIQKIWYLLITGQRVNKKNLYALERGYSCMLDKSHEDDFQEVFKYMTKGSSDDGQVISYDQFTLLDKVLKGVRQIQGYGCLFRIKDDDTLDDSVDSEYLPFIEELQKIERPTSVYESLVELRKDTTYTIISRKRVFKYLRDLPNENLEKKEAPIEASSAVS